MKARVALVAIALAFALVAGSVAPRQAHAMDDIAMIGLISGGVVVGIALIAIIGTALTRDDPRFLTEASPALTRDPLQSQGRVRFGTACPRGGGTTVAVCW